MVEVRLSRGDSVDDAHPGATPHRSDSRLEGYTEVFSESLIANRGLARALAVCLSSMIVASHRVCKILTLLEIRHSFFFFYLVGGTK